MSQRHREWVRQLAAALQPHFDEVRLLNYRHWEQQGTEMDVEYEITRAAAIAKDFGEYVIVAKSIGTVVATLAINQGLLTSQRCVFMGFPLRVVNEDFPELAAAMSHLPPAAFLHNEHDPLGDASAVQAYVSAHVPSSYSFETLPGDTHDYSDFNLIARIAAS